MTLNNEIDNLIIEFNKNIKSIDSNDIDSLNELKNKYLSRKGKLSDLFTKLGSTTSLPGADGSTVSSVKFLDSNVRITGVTTGYRLDIPIRFVKSP